MIIFYVRYGNYYPEEIVAGYFASKEIAEKVCDHLNEKNPDCSMHEVSSLHTEHNVFNSFEDWLKNEETQTT